MSLSDGELKAFSNSRRANASRDQIDGAMAGVSCEFAANGLRMALTTPDTTLIMAVTTLGDTGVGDAAAVGATCGMATDTCSVTVVIVCSGWSATGVVRLLTGAS